MFFYPQRPLQAAYCSCPAVICSCSLVTSAKVGGARGESPSLLAPHKYYFFWLSLIQQEFFHRPEVGWECVCACVRHGWWVGVCWFAPIAERTATFASVAGPKCDAAGGQQLLLLCGARVWQCVWVNVVCFFHSSSALDAGERSTPEWVLSHTASFKSPSYELKHKKN